MIASVSHCMKILQALSFTPSGLTVSEIQAKTAVEKSAVSRVLSTLEEEGYVRRTHRDDVFRLTLKFTGIALEFLGKSDFSDLATPALKVIVGEIGETVQLAVSEGAAPVYIITERSNNPIQAQPLDGTIAHPHASTAGKLWLASMSDFRAIAEISRIELKKLTPSTVTDPEVLLHDIQEIRKLGYAIIEGELFQEINAVAVPLKCEFTGRFLGALCIATPAYRGDRSTLLSYLPLLRLHAKQLSHVISYWLKHSRTPGLTGTYVLEEQHA